MKKIASMIILMANIITVFASTSEVEAKLKKVYLGKFYVSTYNASDNTPRNSHATASGKRAMVGRTVAVDRNNPIVPMGTTVELQKFGKRKVEDTGGFGKYNGGMRKFDVFMPEGKGGLYRLKAWVIRPETKAERKKRLLKEKRRRERIKKERERRQRLERKRRQKGYFLLRYTSEVGDLKAITDPQYIKSGTIRIGTKYIDVVKTRKGLKNSILIGDTELKELELAIKTKLDEVCEEAVG